jgi:hypothetical protein
VKKRETKADRSKGSVYDRADYGLLKAFNDKLLDKNSRLGKIVSKERVRQSSENIQQAIRQTLVNHGHAVVR